jgi:hypothetical protein
VIGPLTEAAAAYERHESLAESRWFGTDQWDNLAAINDLLDRAVAVLAEGEAVRVRERLRALEREIAAREAKLLAWREARVGAPAAGKLNALQGVFARSREDYDALIEETRAELAALRAEGERLAGEFVARLRDLGLEVDLESARSLLATVTGDDFVELCQVGHNLRGLTLQLQELTEESGESLAAAKRYYGVFVVLVRLVDRLQRDFIDRTRREVIPRLQQLAGEAETLIAQARRNMEEGGSERIGRRNIRSNELTLRAVRYYTGYLRAQAAQVEARNRALQVDLRDAVNTWRTVSLSSEVAALIRESSRNFAALLRLELPRLRGFDNRELRAEFRRLTRKVRGVE